MSSRFPMSLLFALAIGTGCASSSPPVETSPPPPDLVVELEYRPSMEPLPQQGRGRLMGSGVGHTSGAIEGEVRWSLYEIQSETTCELHLVGTISSNQGATLEFQAIGFGSRPSSGASLWDMTASAEFTSLAGGASPLTSRVAAWVGRFDATTGRHRYHVHFPAAAGTES